MLALALTLLLTCPSWGDARTPALHQLNVLKNRSTRPLLYAAVPLSRFFGKAALPNAVAVHGWVIAVTQGGPESCHCHSWTALDTHITLAETPYDPDPRHWVIAEIVPGHPLPLPQVGSYIEVRGWTLNDWPHAKNGAPWRGTPLEIHPVLRIIP